MCDANCYNCKHAKMTPYAPATQWEPEELPSLEDCYLDKLSVSQTPEEGCSEWEEREEWDDDDF